MKKIILFSLASIFIKSQNMDFIDSVYDNENEKSNKYFYHSDYSGSTSYVTDSGGSITQHHAYIPFGENFVSEYNKAYYKSDYKFNSKELDSNTGFYYYGARYYNPKTSLWHGTDPLLEKYPNISPYAYVALNPIKYIDPDGRMIAINMGKKSSNIRIFRNLQDLTDDKLSFKANKSVVISQRNNSGNKPKGTELLRRIIQHSTCVNIENGEESSLTSQYFSRNDFIVSYKIDLKLNLNPNILENIIVFNKERNRIEVEVKAPTKIVIAHELIHADHVFRFPLHVNEFDKELSKYNRLGSRAYIDLKTDLKLKDYDEIGEFRTVGFTGYVEPGDITENNIRLEQPETSNTQRILYNNECLY